MISDHGGQFISHDFTRVNQRLRIRHEMYEKGYPWQNLIEIVFTQMTKMRVLTISAGRDNITNFNFLIVYYHSVNEQFN